MHTVNYDQLYYTYIHVYMYNVSACMYMYVYMYILYVHNYWNRDRNVYKSKYIPIYVLNSSRLHLAVEKFLVYIYMYMYM